MTEIRLAKLQDIPAFIEHHFLHDSESGRDGDPIFTPTTDLKRRDVDEVKSSKEKKWGQQPDQVGWERCWLLLDDQGVYGDLSLVHHIPLAASLHRATLMMGIQRSHRGKGFGSKLIQEALNWARQSTNIEWIDLYVFENNKPAIALYKKFNFVEQARVPDIFRIHGQKITDIHMVLKIR